MSSIPVSARKMTCSGMSTGGGFSRPYCTAVYTFTVTGAGQIAGYALARHGVLPGLARISVAVSPDGSEVATTGSGPEAAGLSAASRLRDARIVVLDLRTGSRAVFDGGLSWPGRGSASTASRGSAAAGHCST